MVMKNKKKGGLGKLLQGYHVMILKEISLEERASLRFTGVKLILLIILISIFWIAITFISIQYTPLKSYIIGFQSDIAKRKTLTLFHQVDSLGQELGLLEKYNRDRVAVLLKDEEKLSSQPPKIKPLTVPPFVENGTAIATNTTIANEQALSKKIKILERQLVLKDEEVNQLRHIIESNDTLAMTRINTEKDLDSVLEIQLQKSANEIAFRKELEAQSKFNLFDFETKESTILFACPAKGTIIAPYDAEKEKWSVTVMAKPPHIIKSILDGRVVMVNWSPRNGHTVVIAHDDGYSAVYANIKSPHLKQGDWVKRGQAIATVQPDNASNGVFNFQLWQGQYVLNPEQYIDFK